MKSNRRHALKQLGAAATLGVSGCLQGGDGANPSTSTQQTEDTDEPAVRAAFVYHDAVGDFGWQWAHEQGRRQIEDEFDWLETTVFDSVDPNGSVRRFEQYAQRGFDVIFATSFGYMEPVTKVAKQFPEVVFEHCSGYYTADNLGRYFGRMYEPRYLSGVAAGLLTESNSVGYVAAYPTAEVMRGINAFAEGLGAVAPDATVLVEWTGAWKDVEAERESAAALIEEGIDVMAQHQNTPAAAQTASEAGIWAMGYNSSMADNIGDNFVVSPIWNWEVFYRDTVLELYEDSWQPDFYWKGWDAGIVGLSEWGKSVPESVRSRVAEKRAKLVEGEIEIWAGTPFESYTEEELFRDIDRFVDTVRELSTDRPTP